MNTPLDDRASTIPRVGPDGIAAAVLLSVLATAGFFYVSIMPALVSGLITGLGFSPQLAGRIASCNVYGAAVGAFCAVLLVRRVAWRRAAVVLLCALLLLDFGSMLVRTPGLLAVLRLVHGLAGGLLVGISYGVMSRTASADRCFGVLMIVQSSLGGLGRMFLPRLVPDYGAPVLFLAFTAVSIAALIVLPFLPEFSAPRPRYLSLRASRPRSRGFLWFPICSGCARSSIAAGVRRRSPDCSRSSASRAAPFLPLLYLARAPLPTLRSSSQLSPALR